MELALIKQADRMLTSCGARPIVQGGSCVPIPKAFLMPMVLQPNQAFQWTKEITGEALWEMRAISSDQRMNQVVGARLQIQLPSGRFLFGGNGMDVGQFAGFGSYRYLMGPPEECEPGSKIQVSLSDYTGLESAIAVNLLFEGAYKYFLKGGQIVKRLPPVWQIPRYQGILNENILAPCWMAGYGPPTPSGYTDELFTYSSAEVAIPITGPATATLKIPIDAGLDFICRRLLFAVRADTGASGTFLGRVRTGNGYALIEDFVDLAQYLNGNEYPHDWTVRGGDSVFIDLTLADFAGINSMYMQVHLEGVRRRKVAA